jgi:dienelactone hydrolase
VSQPFPYADGDFRLTGELHRPADLGDGRGVLVVHEADGIGGNVRRRCAMLAQLGYVALAADLYGVGKPLEGDEMRTAMDGLRADSERFRRRIGAGVDALATVADPERLVAIGYCFGGLAVLELARSGAQVRAVASFHGLLTTKAPAGPGAIRAKVAAYTGAKDPLVPPEDIAAFHAEMMTADADWQLAVYGQALHSFTNIGVKDSPDPRMDYDPEADAASWADALRFLEMALA